MLLHEVPHKALLAAQRMVLHKAPGKAMVLDRDLHRNTNRHISLSIKPRTAPQTWVVTTPDSAELIRLRRRSGLLNF